jgi:hypothetical protein
MWGTESIQYLYIYLLTSLNFKISLTTFESFKNTIQNSGQTQKVIGTNDKNLVSPD